MNIRQLFDIQRELDKRIVENHDLHGEDLVTAKVLALEVELGELANETRCFKFWSLKDASPKHMVLEEYVDCLHFILSIGLESGLDGDDFVVKDNSKDLIEQFQEMFQKSATFNKDRTKENYINLFNTFLSLGKKLGFTWDEIQKAYLMKNEINHQRQDEGY